MFGSRKSRMVTEAEALPGRDRAMPLPLATW